ncbi:MAG: hypothetical protein U1A78_31725 [Polyangia bacterium]
MRSFKNTTIRSYLYCLAFSAAAAGGCGDAQVAKSQVDLIDKVSHALTTSTVRALKGTYGAGCIQRTGTWALGLNGFTPTEDALSVVKNNADCVLSLSEVHAGTLAAPAMYSMTAPMALDSAFASNGAAFMLDGQGDTVFYANFRIQPDLTFNTNFSLEMVYSDDSTEVTAQKSAAYAVQTSTASSSNVAPPDYLISLSGISLQVDAGDVVQTASGSASLTEGSVLGEQYVIDQDTLSATPTFADIDALFAAGQKSNLTPGSPSIPVADFALGGTDLTAGQKRNVIIANIENGTRAYQIFRVTFNRP